jgi:hypothetical protein
MRSKTCTTKVNSRRRPSFSRWHRRWNPENPTPRYNRPCAEARQAKVTQAVLLLRGLPPAAGLRVKVERDQDFDGIREEPEFVRFLASLPPAGTR